MSNRLDPDQARHFVGPDLGPNCLQKLSADDNSRKRVNNVSACSYVIIWASAQDVRYGTYFIGEQQMLRQICADSPEPSLHAYTKYGC